VACAAERRKREARAGRTGHPDEVLTGNGGEQAGRCRAVDVHGPALGVSV
jgi:hypothetical protein